MTTVRFRLSADTDLETLVEIACPALRPVKNLVRDMIEGGDFGEIEAEIGGDGTARDHDINILFVPAAGRAGIVDNASTRWTDASSLEDAERRYREDDLAQ